MKSELFNWPHQSKESWLDQVLKDNPRTPLSEYIIPLNDGLSSDPFAFYADLSSNETLNILSIMPGDWKTGTQLVLSDVETTKSELHFVLDNGIEYLTLNILENQNSDQFEKIFKHIHLDYFQTTWIFPDSFGHSREILEYIQQNSLNPNRHICNSKNNLSGGEYDTAHFSITNLDPYPLSEVLLRILTCISEHSICLKNILLNVYLTHDFLKNIYTLRALRIVLQNIKEIHNLNLEFKIEARIDPGCYTENQHNNLIIASTVSGSAILSGIDYLIPERTFNTTSQSQWNWKKSAIHLQQILKQEAKLNGLKDPVSGSYYLDKMTLLYAQKLWNALQEKIKQ